MGKGSKPQKAAPSQAERALASVSLERWNAYVRTYLPAERQAVESARVTEGEIAAAEGAAAGDTQAAFADAARATVRQVGSTTGGVSSGATKLALAANSTAKAEALGTGRALAARGAEEQELGDFTRLAGFGQGAATEVVNSLGTATSRATRLSIAAAEARNMKRQARMEMLGAIGGAAFRASKWGKSFAENGFARGDQPELLKSIPKKQRRLVDATVSDFDYSGYS